MTPNALDFTLTGGNVLHLDASVLAKPPEPVRPDVAVARLVRRAGSKGDAAADAPPPQEALGAGTQGAAGTIAKLERYARSYAQKSGSYLHPDPSVTEAVVLGLAQNAEDVGRPLCPCRFYPDKAAAAAQRTWVCACDDMQVYKYCHCLLFTNEEGLPITEHLPEDHTGRRTYGLVRDPHPDQGRPWRHKATEREVKRAARES